MSFCPFLQISKTYSDKDFKTLLGFFHDDLVNKWNYLRNLGRYSSVPMESRMLKVPEPWTDKMVLAFKRMLDGLFIFPYCEFALDSKIYTFFAYSLTLKCLHTNLFPAIPLTISCWWCCWSLGGHSRQSDSRYGGSHTIHHMPQ